MSRFSDSCNHPSTTEARRRPHQPHASLHQEPDHFLPELCVQGIEVDHLLLRPILNPMLVVGNRRGYLVSAFPSLILLSDTGPGSSIIPFKTFTILSIVTHAFVDYFNFFFIVIKENIN